jgi:hypothetical protein
MTSKVETIIQAVSPLLGTGAGAAAAEAASAGAAAAALRAQRRQPVRRPQSQPRARRRPGSWRLGHAPSAAGQQTQAQHKRSK